MKHYQLILMLYSIFYVQLGAGPAALNDKEPDRYFPIRELFRANPPN